MIKRLKILLTLTIISSSAQAADPLCYLQEENPKTKNRYQSQQELNFDKMNWDQRNPGLPNPFYLFKAYGIYKSELIKALNMPSDKRAHCFIGCRISQETNYHTADYVGWLKEKRDISDCHPETHFDIEDHIATQRGAQFGESLRTSQDCENSCSAVY